jgi:endoglucanase
MSGTASSRLRRHLAIAALVLLAWIPATRMTAAQETPPGSGYWHTAGTQILDAAGRPVRIAGVTWYGMESSHWVPAGLDFQRYTTIMDLVKLLGYTTIRLPFSNELVERNPIVTGGVAANPQFRGQPALAVMDAIAAYAQQIGLKIILDDHRSRAGRPMGINTLDEALWYTAQYPESAWIHDWQTLAARYRGNDAVIGFDLRNEPHTTGSGPWDLAAYLQRSATWGPYHGFDHPATDWRLAAERAGNAVLAINPHLLIIVQGLPIYPASSGSTVISSWWAGLLMPVKRYPVELRVPHQLVYSVHEWGPRKHAMPWFSPLSYQSLLRAWRRNWSFVLDHPNAPYAAPILLGEFGTCTDIPACLTGQQAGDQGTWFQLLHRFIAAHPELSWSFYALNGTNSNNCWADNGLLNASWNNVASLTLQGTLRTLQPMPGLLPAQTAAPLLPGTATTRKPRSARSPLCQLP